jgi:hypothetical protein
MGLPELFMFDLLELKYLIIIVAVVYAVSANFIGIYLFTKGFKISFYALILHGVYYMFILFYWYQLLLGKVNLDSYMLAYYILTTVSLVLGLSLLFSKVRKRIWIKRAGIVILVISSIHITSELFPELMKKPMLQLVRDIGSFLASFGSIFWILNFQDEIKALPHESDNLVDAPLE